MKKLFGPLGLALAIASVVGGVFVPQVEARTELVVKNVKWQNRAPQRAAIGGNQDTLYLTLGSAAPCTTMAIDIKNLIIPPYPQYAIGGVTTAQGDSSWTIGRILVIADSASTNTAFLVKIDGLAEAAGNTATHEPMNGVAVVDSFTMSAFTAAKLYSIPIKLPRASFATAGNAVGTAAAGSAHNLLFWPNIRISLTATGGVAGQARVKFVHYADVP